LWSKNQIFSAAITSVTSSLLSVLYLCLFVIAGISIFAALNQTEALVCFARFIVTMIGFFNLAVLFYQRLHLFRILAQALALLLLLQSLGVVTHFFNGYGETDLNQLILSTKGNAGNKNILAASLVMKLPFAFYCIYSFKLGGKIFNLLAVAVAAFAIVILNARASYISTLLIAALYIIYCLATADRKRKLHLAKNIALVVVPIAAGIIFSQITLKNAIALQDTETGYGTLSERLSTISLTKEGSNYRILQWNSALDYIKHHPLVGAGYGNWKLASIPYERTFSNDLLVTYHVHNDFLELAAETGLPGAVLFLGLFIVAAVYAFRTLLSQRRSEAGSVAAFSLMALAVYFIDAFFNFPNERPIMQFFMALVFALLLNVHLQNQKTKAKTDAPNRFFKPAFIVVCLLLLLPSVWLTHMTYRSMAAQREINSDVLLATPAKSWEEVNSTLPSVPNLNAFAFPVDAIKAKYLMKDKRYAEALALLDKSYAVNPYLPYNDFLKANVYIELNQLDSAKKYADIAFAKRPRSLANMRMRNFISYKRNDTATLNQTFNTFAGYRNDQPAAWNDYLNYVTVMPYTTPVKQALLDSALKLFPDDKELQQKKTDVPQGNAAPAFEAAAPFVTKGMQAFTKKDYASAIQNFTRAAELNPGDYSNWENIAVCYYVENNFKAASSFFDKVIQLNTAKDGKSEYFKAFCLISLGDKTGGCTYLQLAARKNYPGAKAQLAANCK
ncbi:MAG TPA: O-antigen ligase family protein, partial [Flavisolibacter sp.]|nr:O-antigen ligase family protein [Flavisolibacter sp.]